MSVLSIKRGPAVPGGMSPVVLFEDQDLIVVDKPEGIASIPERDASREHLIGMLSGGRQEQLFVVHRLDKEVSGLIIFARNAAAHKFLNDQFERRRVQKSYVALVHGQITGESGRIDAPLRQFGSGRVGVDTSGGKPCVTEYTVTRRFNAVTLLEVKPLTGRRHQIRAHLYSTGHPIVGDLRYGDRKLQSTYSRLMLHAHRLTLTVPSGEPLTVEAPVPEEFLRIIAVFERA